MQLVKSFSLGATVLGSLIPLAAASCPSGATDIESCIITDPTQVQGKVYDYIIVGGGLTGLAMAETLSQNQNVTVLVVEAGYYESDLGPIITDLNTYGQIFDTEVDWQYITTPFNSTEKQQIVHAGKGFGGSTLVNGGTWTRPASVQIDSWESVFGNEGWTWNAIYPYLQKVEIARPPNAVQIAAGHRFNHSCHGYNGTVDIGPRDTGAPWSPCMMAIMAEVNKTGVPTQVDLSCGSPRGVSMFPNSLTSGQIRADAAREWLLPNYQRPNLDLLAGQYVGRVLISTTNGSYPTAYGVEFGTHKTTTYQAYANHEVHIAAGSSSTPLILEYSGIGRAEFLSQYNITQYADLPVGFNQIDQTTVGVRAVLNDHGKGQGQAAYFASFNETYGELAPQAAQFMTDNLDQWAQGAVDRGGHYNVTALRRQYDMQVDWLLNHDVAYAELFFDAGDAISFDVWDLIPFTRGYIHIANADPYLRKYVNNPQFFEVPLDVWGQAAATQLARNLSRNGEMAQYFGGETTPGDSLNQNATFDEWQEYVRANYRANYHAVGTATMASREMGGVVDSTAKVYGIAKLRVIDGSIPPTQVSSHVMNIFYAMALRIADLVIADYHSTMAQNQA